MKAKIKTSILTLVLALSINLLGAQTLGWVKKMGGTGYESPASIITDKNENIYTCGYFEGTVDFNPGTGVFNLTSAGDRDIFVQKINNYGNFIWAKRIGGISSDEAFAIASDDSGNILITGQFLGTVDFDPGTGVNNIVSGGGRVMVLYLN